MLLEPKALGCGMNFEGTFQGIKLLHKMTESLLFLQGTVNEMYFFAVNFEKHCVAHK